MTRPPNPGQQRWSGWRFEQVRFPADPRSGALRIGDAEREEACRALGEHFAAGRLTRAEFDERTTAAWAARTRADLGPLFADLPAPRADGLSRPAPSGTVAAPAPRWRFPWLAWIVSLIALAWVSPVPWPLLAVGLWLLFSWVRDRVRRRGSRCSWGHRT